MSAKSAQEVFDLAVEHMARQRSRSVDTKYQGTLEGNSCRYRDSKGRKCIIGAFIPDELYSPLMEGESIESILIRSPQSYGPLSVYFRENFPGLYKRYESQPYGISTKCLAAELQAVHDDWNEDEGFEQLKALFLKVAEDYGFNTEKLSLLED